MMEQGGLADVTAGTDGDRRRLGIGQSTIEIVDTCTYARGMELAERGLARMQCTRRPR
jgi:hypothetical protein